MKNKKLVYYIWSIAVIISATLWSLDWILIRPQFYQFPAINIVFLEHLLWAILLSPFLFLWWNKLKKLKRKDVFSLLWVCLFWWLIWTLAITEAFFSAFRWETTLSTVVILQKLQPVFALFLASIILKEKLNFRFYIWAIVSIVSAYFIAFWNILDNIWSINFLNTAAFFALIAAFSFWSSTVFWKSLVDDLWFKLTTSLRFTITSVLAFFTLLAFWDIFSIWDLELIYWKLLLIIVFSSWAVALFLYYFWLKKISASSATIFELAWPLSSILFDYLINGNILSPIQIVFSIILFISFFMVSKEWTKKA